MEVVGGCEMKKAPELTENLSPHVIMMMVVVIMMMMMMTVVMMMMMTVVMMMIVMMMMMTVIVMMMMTVMMMMIMMTVMMVILMAGGEKEFQGEAAVYTRRLSTSAAGHGQGGLPWGTDQEVRLNICGLELRERVCVCVHASIFV